MTPDLGIEPGPHWWEASALTTAPSLHPNVGLVGWLVNNHINVVNVDQEKMRGQRGRLPVRPLGYVMSTKVIFRRAEVFVLAEVCLPRRPHAGQPRSDV